VKSFEESEYVSSWMSIYFIVQSNNLLLAGLQLQQNT